MSRCITCQHLSVADQPPEWRKVGAYRCPKRRPWEFRSAFAERECKHYAQVSPEDMPARVAFEQRATQ